MKQKRIKIKGKNIFYYESRDNGHPVVFVHGMSSSASIFIRQLIDSVLSYQFRFIALDLIGYGNSEASDKPQDDYTIKGLSEFLTEFNNELNIENAVYVGHNFGANIIIDAFNKLNNPAGLVLLGSVPLSNPVTEEMFLKKSFFKFFAKPGLDDSEVHQASGLFVEEKTKYPDFIPEIIRKADLKTREYLFGSIMKGEFQDQTETIKNINVPVAVYFGEFDQIINLDYLNSVNIPTIWKNQIQIIRDTGHIFFYESPADFNISTETYLHTVFNK
ncbi:MAG: alpha/beta hydrolase [Bacteroidales bacterium]|nr:alpha/beta hydrolase [Bacteroidales bacterium]